MRSRNSSMTHTMEQLFLSKSKDNKPEFNGRSVADSVVLFQAVKGRYKRPLTSRDFIGL